MTLVEPPVAGVADEQAGVVEQGVVALGALLGSGTDLDEEMRDSSMVGSWKG